MSAPDDYCFGCDRALMHCLCHLAGLGEDDQPRTDTIPSDPRVKALVDAASRLISVERDSACEMRAVDDVEAAIAAMKGAAK